MCLDLQKAFFIVVGGFMADVKGVSAKFMEAMHNNVKVSVNLEKNRITQMLDSADGVRQECALSPIVYVYGIISKLGDANIH
jgi:hypothetical protein